MDQKSLRTIRILKVLKENFKRSLEEVITIFKKKDKKIKEEHRIFNIERILEEDFRILKEEEKKEEDKH